MNTAPPKGARCNLRKTYPLDQCALFKVGSKKRLADVLLTELPRLLELAGSSENYKIFQLPKEVCPFTRKTRKARWVQEPKSELRGVHERIRKLLSHVAPPMYAHAAIKGRSYRSNAYAHKDSCRVATFDLRRFYPSTSESRAYDFWASEMCCAADVARLLTKLTCYAGAIPTGSPLSPLLSLFVNKPMFDAFHALALKYGMAFTCYVDDLTFSGLMVPRGLRNQVANVALRFGHGLSSEKTRIFNRNQGKHVTGIVVCNGKLHVPHSRFRKARAIWKSMDQSSTVLEKLALARKLSGLLNEAAYLDERYARFAKAATTTMKRLGTSAGFGLLASEKLIEG